MRRLVARGPTRHFGNNAARRRWRPRTFVSFPQQRLLVATSVSIAERVTNNEGPGNLILNWIHLIRHPVVILLVAFLLRPCGRLRDRLARHATFASCQGCAALHGAIASSLGNAMAPDIIGSRFGRDALSATFVFKQGLGALHRTLACNVGDGSRPAFFAPQTVLLCAVVTVLLEGHSHILLVLPGVFSCLMTFITEIHSHFILFIFGLISHRICFFPKALSHFIRPIVILLLLLPHLFFLNLLLVLFLLVVVGALMLVDQVRHVPSGVPQQPLHPVVQVFGDRAGLFELLQPGGETSPSLQRVLPTFRPHAPGGAMRCYRLGRGRNRLHELQAEQATGLVDAAPSVACFVPESETHGALEHLGRGEAAARGVALYQQRPLARGRPRQGDVPSLVPRQPSQSLCRFEG
mmetsp:Transcript_47771/g.133173  ORF Transcript_47771/g.133173 Transcript_47771/m.133173 type:complete len:408 (-) Transcript_47771:388-1611(-)